MLPGIKFGAGIAAMALFATGLTACSVGGGDGTVNFGTGVKSDHTLTSEKSTFAPTDMLYYRASLSDTVKAGTVTRKVISSGKTASVKVKLGDPNADVDVITGGPYTAADFVGSGTLGKITIQILSNGKVEASGTLTVGKSSSQTSSSSQGT